MQCVECSGTGKISCGACWNGHTKSRCPECNGTGNLLGSNGEQSVCPRCHGLGQFVPPSCPVCGNCTICPKCEGSGQC